MADAVSDDVHVFPFRVYYEDTDAGGIVYYANYLKFAERARSELLRHLGTNNTALMKKYEVMFAVRDCSITYYKPAYLDEALEVHTRVTGVGGATLSAHQRVMRSGTLLTDMSVRLACLSHAGRPARLPAEIRSVLASLQKRS